jgi:rhamnosyltransferase
MARPLASVLVPTHNPGERICTLFEAVLAQQTEFPFEIIVVDSSSKPTDVALMRQYPIDMHQIPRTAFGHGKTRNLLAELARGDLLLYLSQDAEPASTTWMQQLIQPLSEPRVAGSYAQQIPRRDADPLIRFFLARTYSSQPARRRIGPSSRVCIEDIFFSNVSSAIRREVWEHIRFRDDLVMSEDQYWAYDVLRAGYEIRYEPAAQVYHSHNYSLRSLFRRNWLSGASLRGLIADSPTAIARRGADYLAAQAMYLLRTGRPHWLPYMFVYELTKAAGFSMGMRFGRQHS